MPISSNTSSQPLFQVEAKMDTEPYEGEVDAVKLNYWLQQLEVYFSVHYIR